MALIHEAVKGLLEAIAPLIAESGRRLADQPLKPVALAVPTKVVKVTAGLETMGNAAANPFDRCLEAGKIARGPELDDTSAIRASIPAQWNGVFETVKMGVHKTVPP
jgi:hypothetical protein